MSRVALGMALIDAVKSGDRAAVASLLESGADPDVTDLFDGLSALEHARRAGRPEILELLRPNGLPPSGANGAAEASAVGQPSWVNPLMARYFSDGYVCRPGRSAEAG